MSKNPKTSKGRRRLYEVSAVAWFDLLGYGSMLQQVNFDPTKSEAILALQRLNQFHEFVAQRAGRHFPIHAINDGIIAFKDLSPRAHSVTFAFLDRAIKLFQEFNKLDKDKGFPGARMVIAAGFRVRIKGSDLGKAGYIKSIESRLSEGAISSSQAINEAYKSRPYFGLLPELQANFAFTRRT